MNKDSIILSHSGKQHSYYVAKTLDDLGYLKEFHTSVYIGSKLFQKGISKFGPSYLTRRYLPGLTYPIVHPHWHYEFRELIMRKFGKSGATVNEQVYKRDVSFDVDMAIRLRTKQYQMFWGFQGSCLESLREAKKNGRLAVCEMTIAHLPFSKKILNEEATLQPDWADSIDFSNFPKEYESRLIEEPEEASHVIAISSFLKDSLVNEGVHESKISVIPLGFDVQAVKYNQNHKSIENRPLKLLFAGRITQRKGVQYLLDAIRSFSKDEVELHFIGNVHGEGSAFRKQSDLYKHRFGVSQQELFSLYADYDVLVFPSILEGFGLVTVEAMGAGLPVITTLNTNAREIMVDGENGYIVPIRDSKSIVDAIKKIRALSNDEFLQMRLNARNSALDFTWDKYRVNVLNFLNEVEL